MDQARGMLGDNGAKALEGMLASAQKPKEGIIASALGIVVLIIGATTVFAELETNLNRIWKVEAEKGSGLWHFIRTRLLSFGMVLAIGFLLIVSLVVSAGIAAWGKYWNGWFGAMEVLLHVANFLVLVAIVTILFAIIYKLMPRVTIRWHDVWIGALVVLLVWVHYSAQTFLLGAEFTKVYAESHGSKKA